MRNYANNAKKYACAVMKTVALSSLPTPLVLANDTPKWSCEAYCMYDNGTLGGGLVNFTSSGETVVEVWEDLQKKCRSRSAASAFLTHSRQSMSNNNDLASMANSCVSNTCSDR